VTFFSGGPFSLGKPTAKKQRTAEYRTRNSECRRQSHRRVSSFLSSVVPYWNSCGFPSHKSLQTQEKAFARNKCRSLAHRSRPSSSPRMSSNREPARHVRKSRNGEHPLPEARGAGPTRRTTRRPLVAAIEFLPHERLYYSEHDRWSSRPIAPPTSSPYTAPRLGVHRGTSHKTRFGGSGSGRNRRRDERRPRGLNRGER